MKSSVTRFAVAAAFGFAATAVLAGEIILYENPGFQGRRMTLRGTTPDLDRTQFNDRAESIAESQQMCVQTARALQNLQRRWLAAIVGPIMARPIGRLAAS